jgi:hypothetical protein
MTPAPDERRRIVRQSRSCRCTLDYRCARHAEPPRPLEPAHSVDIRALAEAAGADLELLSAAYELGLTVGLADGSRTERTRSQLEQLAALERLFHDSEPTVRVAAICARLGVRRSRYYALRRELAKSAKLAERRMFELLQEPRRTHSHEHKKTPFPSV